MPERGIDINSLMLDANLSISARVCLLVIMSIMSIAQLAVGAMYKNDCPQQPYIPIYLMVMGIITLLSLFSTVACNASSGSLGKVCSGLVSLFLFCWFIAGNVWIYSIYEPNYDKTTTGMKLYCDKTVYQLAFWTTNLIYILFGFLSCIVFCFFCLFSA
ncbi:transmembrane protein 272-like [Thunnus albacares]|uniref:transmembrane protein 272-like n=1 Tax=Thunnus albacares TaxID=8236 RepID=UPI001CF715C7|nr:transmembrane protein 272-like [Thunnus albacares]XP_044196935.1 transmembrane protein 272-like [Thunnus albacares]